MKCTSKTMLAFWACLGMLVADAGHAGNLKIYESSVGQGLVRTISGPVTNALIDVDYAPISAEGGKLYGMSEVEIQTTGDLVLTTTGFACQATWCLYSPSPFVAGKRIRITGGNDLQGEISATANLLTIGVTGSNGHVVLVRGDYLDGTGASSSVGAIRTIDARPLVTVPEPGAALGLAAGCVLIALATRARASSRSGSAPASRAPRGR